MALLFTSRCSGRLCLQIQALARLAYMQSCGLCLCFPVVMTAIFFFSFSLLAMLFFVSCHSPYSPHFQEEARLYCSTGGNHYRLLSLSSTFCISYSRVGHAGLWLEVGCLNCWLTWELHSLASAFVGSVA